MLHPLPTFGGWRPALLLPLLLGGLGCPSARAQVQAPGIVDVWAIGTVAPALSGQSSILTALPDAAGRVAVCGAFTGEVSFGTTILTSRFLNEAFLGQRDAQGNWLWVRPLGFRVGGPGPRLARDAQGNFYVTGQLIGTATFGSTTLTAANGPQNVFVGKLDPQGNWLWAQHAANAPTAYGNGLALDAAGNVYLSGTYALTSTFGTTTLPVSGPMSLNGFVAKLDAQGSWLWAKRFVSQYQADAVTIVQALAVDGGGDVYVCGQMDGTGALLDTLPLPAVSPDGDIVVAKLSTNGTVLWARAYGSPGFDRARTLALDAAGNAYVTGNFTGATLPLGSTILTRQGLEDAFIAKLDAQGNALWARSSGGAGSAAFHALTLAPDGSVGLAGAFAGTVTLGSTPLTSRGLTDAFVAQLDAQGNWRWAKSQGGPMQDAALGISADANGTLYVGGAFQGPSATFDAITLSTAATGQDRGFLLRVGTTVTAAHAPARLAGLELYPNPAPGRAALLTATRLSGPAAELRVLNALGQVVHHATPALPPDGTLRYPLALPALPAGLYTVQLRTTAGTLVGKLLLQ